MTTVQVRWATLESVQAGAGLGARPVCMPSTDYIEYNSLAVPCRLLIALNHPTPMFCGWEKNSKALGNMLQVMGTLELHFVCSLFCSYSQCDAQAHLRVDGCLAP